MTDLDKWLLERERIDNLWGNEIFDPRGHISCLGYDSAKEMGILDLYMDSLGRNFNRCVDWDSKYPQYRKRRNRFTDADSE